MKQGTFIHVFRDKLISFTLIHKIDCTAKISDLPVHTESIISIFWYMHVLAIIFQLCLFKTFTNILNLNRLLIKISCTHPVY